MIPPSPLAAARFLCSPTQPGFPEELCSILLSTSSPLSSTPCACTRPLSPRGPASAHIWSPSARSAHPGGPLFRQPPLRALPWHAHLHTHLLKLQPPEPHPRCSLLVLTCPGLLIPTHSQAQRWPRRSQALLSSKRLRLRVNARWPRPPPPSPPPSLALMPAAAPSQSPCFQSLRPPSGHSLHNR